MQNKTSLDSQVKYKDVEFKIKLEKKNLYHFEISNMRIYYQIKSL